MSANAKKQVGVPSDLHPNNPRSYSSMPEQNRHVTKRGVGSNTPTADGRAIFFAVLGAVVGTGALPVIGTIIGAWLGYQFGSSLAGE